MHRVYNVHKQDLVTGTAEYPQMIWPFKPAKFILQDLPSYCRRIDLRSLIHRLITFRFSIFVDVDIILSSYVWSKGEWLIWGVHIEDRHYTCGDDGISAWRVQKCPHKRLCGFHRFFWVVVLPARTKWTPGGGEDIVEINWQIGVLSWKATHHKWIDGLADPAHWSYQVRWMCLGVGVGVWGHPIEPIKQYAAIGAKKGRLYEGP